MRWATKMLEGMTPHPLITARSFRSLCGESFVRTVSVTRYFGIKPSRFEQTIGYMANKNWGEAMRQKMWDKIPNSKSQNPKLQTSNFKSQSLISNLHDHYSPLTSISDFHAAEELQRQVWLVRKIIAPLHILLTVAQNGGVVIGGGMKTNWLASFLAFPWNE